MKQSPTLSEVPLRHTRPCAVQLMVHPMNVTQRSENPAPARKAKARPDPRQQLFTIGDLAREFSVSLRTLRFYEDRGLLSPYREGTARYYRDEDKSRLALILKGKHLGFTLGEIRDMLTSKRTGAQAPTSLTLNPEQIASQIHHLERQRMEIDQAIEELRATHQRLLAQA
jgi:DNA-binding transcriptional MerR regulator